MITTNLDEGNQLIIITAARGVGKTNAATTFLPPSRISEVFLHDSEDSANNVVVGLMENGIEFGHYANLKSRFANRMPSNNDLLSAINSGQLPWTTNAGRNALIDYYLAVLDDLNTNLTPGKYGLYVHDTIEGLEAGMAAWVDNNKRQAGVSTIAFGKMWTDGVYPLYTQFLESIHSRGVKTIILTSHLKTPWEGNRPVTGKVVPSGKKILYFLSRLFVWLVRDTRNVNGEPAGLVLKERLAKFTVDKKTDDWRIQRMLPRRIPCFTWSNVRKYLVEGANLENPPDNEVFSPEEEELISDMALSDKQMELMLTERRIELEKVKLGIDSFVKPEGNLISAPSYISSDVDANVREILSSHETRNPQDVRNLYLEIYKAEVPLPVVLRALKELQQ